MNPVALAHPWPTLVLRAPTEAAARAALASLEADLGPLPQADWVEPFGPDDPDGWEVWVSCPGLPIAAWLQVADRATLTGGRPPGELAAEAEGRLVCEALSIDGWTAERWTFDGEPAPPDLLRRPEVTDPVLEALVAAVALGVHQTVPAVRLLEATPVVHRRDGRSGLELTFDHQPLEDLDPERAHDVRAEVLAGVARGLGDVPLPVHPRLHWDAPLGGIAFVLWLGVPCAAPLPPDGGDGAPPDALTACGGRLAALELQLRPRGTHLEAAMAVEALAAQGLEIAPVGARWWAGRFCPAWWVTGGAWSPPPAAAADAWRLVPVPAYAADSWPLLDLGCWREGGVTFVRLTDPTGRDWLSPATPRPLAPEQAWRMVAGATSARALGGLRDPDGAEGLEWSFSADSWRPERLRGLLRAVADAVLPDPRRALPVGEVAHTPDGTLVRIWFAEP